MYRRTRTLIYHVYFSIVIFFIYFLTRVTEKHCVPPCRGVWRVCIVCNISRVLTESSSQTLPKMDLSESWVILTISRYLYKKNRQQSQILDNMKIPDKILFAFTTPTKHLTSTCRSPCVTGLLMQIKFDRWSRVQCSFYLYKSRAPNFKTKIISNKLPPVRFSLIFART